MQALVEARPGALQREILLASTEIQRAHRRVAVLRLEQERLGRFPRRAERDRLGLVPRAQALLDTGAVADDNQVERIALDGVRRIAGASRLPFNPGTKSGLVELLGAADRSRILGRMRQDKAGHLDSELKISHVAATEQSYVDPFHSFVQAGEDEPARFLSGQNNRGRESQRAEEFSHSSVR